VLDPEPREQEVRIADLVVDVGDGPVEDDGEEVLDDALRRALSGMTKALALTQPVESPRLECGPA
jgi:hypothetical protein